MKCILSKIISTIVLILFTIALFISQTSAANIPANIEKAFVTKYPAAENVLWKKYMENQYLAIFIQNEQEVNVFFNDKGEVLETLVELDHEHLPARIEDRFTELPKGWKVNYILKLQTSSQFEYYRAKVQFENTYYEFIFDQNHYLVSVQTIE